MYPDEQYFADPYYYLLLKELFEFEVGYFFDKVTALTACHYVHIGNQNPKSIDEIWSLVEKAKEETEYPKGTSVFKRLVWNNVTNFEFTQHRLNLLARSILILGKYNSWEAFMADNVNNSVDFEQHKRKTYKELRISGVLNVIKTEVFGDLARLTREAQERGKFKGFDYRIILFGDKGMTLRYAEAKDRVASERLRDELCLPKEIFNKNVIGKQYNDYQLVVADTFDEVIGGIIMLPANKKFYDDFASKRRFGYSFGVVDLDSKLWPEHIFLSELTYDNDLAKDMIIDSLMITIKNVFGMLFSKIGSPFSSKLMVHCFAEANDRTKELKNIGFIDAKSILIKKATFFTRLPILLLVLTLLLW